MTSPYANLPARAYWRSGVVQRGPIQSSDLYQPKFRISRKQRIVTAGSCFAQHVGRTLRAAKFNVLDAEKGPSLPKALLNQYGYELYSARYGNVYTARQMLQLLREAFDGLKPSHPVWEKDGRFYDAFRPSVEPNGLPSAEDVIQHREQHLEAVRTLFTSLDIFVFTFGLTETWEAVEDGTVYPTAPETIAGTYDPDVIAFKNMRYNEVLSDFKAVRKIIRDRNPRAKFMVTVSPVPLTATASGQHVEAASSYSKSVLRSVCGALYEDFKDIDYFPSYEVVTSQTSHGTNFEGNYRSVRGEAVDKAMALFMQAHGGIQPTAAPQKPTADVASAKEDVVCEEALLEAFNK